MVGSCRDGRTSALALPCRDQSFGRFGRSSDWGPMIFGENCHLWKIVKTSYSRYDVSKLGTLKHGFPTIGDEERKRG